MSKEYEQMTMTQLGVFDNCMYPYCDKPNRKLNSKKSFFIDSGENEKEIIVRCVDCGLVEKHIVNRDCELAISCPNCEKIMEE